jgi:hypothetical protein
MEIVLPTSRSQPEVKNPKNLIIFSKPKTGKTNLLATLDSCLLVDLEDGSDYVSAMKVKAKSIKDIKLIGKEIKKAGRPYKFVAIDTITALEEMCVPYAEELYSQSPMGKNWFIPETGGKAKYGNILGIPEGRGYYWLRISFTKVLDYIMTWADHTILLGHVKDTMLEKDGVNVSIKELDLTGKLKRITTSNSDAIAYLYRKGQQNILSFKTTDDVGCGARPDHLKNAEIVISEINEEGEYITHWDKVFID